MTEWLERWTCYFSFEFICFIIPEKPQKGQDN